MTVGIVSGRGRGRDQSGRVLIGSCYPRRSLNFHDMRFSLHSFADWLLSIACSRRQPTRSSSSVGNVLTLMAARLCTMRRRGLKPEVNYHDRASAAILAILHVSPTVSEGGGKTLIHGGSYLVCLDT